MTEQHNNSTVSSQFKNRRKARELAFHTLYACEIGEQLWESTLERIAESNSTAIEAKRYARDLVSKVMENSSQIDSSVSQATANWELRRMAAVDRNLLRLAVAELLFFKDVPYKVVIDEAVELAKLYGTAESGKFVNGIIDSIYRKSIESTSTL